MYLIDSSVWIAGLRRGGPVYVANQVKKWILNNEAATMPVIRIELSAGCRSQEQFDALDESLSGLINLPLREKHYQMAANLAFTLRKQGVTSRVPDLLIATCAASAGGCTLVHADNGFDPIAEVLSLVHINWSKKIS